MDTRPIVDPGNYDGPNQKMLQRIHGEALSASEETVAAIRAIMELQHQMPCDLCGQQREYALPRINTIFLFMLKTFPRNAAEAMEGAVDGYGDPIV